MAVKDEDDRGGALPAVVLEQPTKVHEAACERDHAKLAALMDSPFMYGPDLDPPQLAAASEVMAGWRKDGAEGASVLSELAALAWRSGPPGHLVRFLDRRLSQHGDGATSPGRRGGRGNQAKGADPEHATQQESSATAPTPTPTTASGARSDQPLQISKFAIEHPRRIDTRVFDAGEPAGDGEIQAFVVGLVVKNTGRTPVFRYRSWEDATGSFAAQCAALDARQLHTFLGLPGIRSTEHGELTARIQPLLEEDVPPSRETCWRNPAPPQGRSVAANSAENQCSESRVDITVPRGRVQPRRP